MSFQGAWLESRMPNTVIERGSVTIGNPVAFTMFVLLVAVGAVFVVSLDPFAKRSPGTRHANIKIFFMSSSFGNMLYTQRTSEKLIPEKEKLEYFWGLLDYFCFQILLRRASILFLEHLEEIGIILESTSKCDLFH